MGAFLFMLVMNVNALMHAQRVWRVEIYASRCSRVRPKNSNIHTELARVRLRLYDRERSGMRILYALRFAVDFSSCAERARVDLL